MKNKKWIPFAVFAVVFIVSLIGFNYAFVGKNAQAVSETSEASLPVLTIQVGSNKIDQLHGYTTQMDHDLLRDSIVPLETDYNFSVILGETNENIDSVSYKVYETDNTTVKEKGIASFIKEKKQTKAEVDLKEKLQRGNVYLLELSVENERGVHISYYTRIKYGTELHFTECMKFIKKFHEAALEGGTNGNQYVSTFIEPKESNLNNDLSKVDINSNADLVCYAGMKPIVERTLPAKVKEITEDLSSVEIQTILSHENSNGDKEYYMATEYFKVRYSVSRMYLLDYERTQEEYFQYDAVDTSKNRFRIGTTADNEKDLHTQNDCEYAAFVQQNQLWLYDYQAGEMVDVFSFLGEDYRNVRNGYDAHKVDILKMDKKGNITFMVYGYMNRGSHEGQNGICIYKFNCKDRVNEEIMFVPTEISYENMEEDISRLAYLNNEDVFYFYLDGSIYKVDANGKEAEVVQSGLTANKVASSDGGVLAISDGNQIRLCNMENDTEQKITCASTEEASAIGFIDNDFIYGIADKSMIQTNADGSTITPMKKIMIVDKNLVEKTSYEKNGVYILSATAQGTSVKMERASKKGAKYKKLADDYIHYKEDGKGKITFEYSYDSDLYNRLYMTFPTYVYVAQAPELVSAKESATDNYKTITFKDNKERSKQYYVYAKGQLSGSYQSVKEAIVAAKQGAGVVVDSKQNYVWEKGVAKEYAKVSNVGIVKAKKNTQSLAACIQMVLKLNAKDVSYDKLAKETGNALTILEKYLGEKAVNLSGCSLDDVLYYISEGRPIIAQRKNGTYIVLMSYNSTKIRYIDPIKGESVQGDRAKLQKEIKNQGNIFYSYTQ